MDARGLFIENENGQLKDLAEAIAARTGAEIRRAAGMWEALRELKRATAGGVPYSLVAMSAGVHEMAQEAFVARSRKLAESAMIIVLTPKGATEDQLAGLRGGADDWIELPCDPELFVLKCEKLLAKQQLADELRRSTTRNQKLFLNLLQVMARVLEAKDSYTRFHSDNVARYAYRIGRRMGFPRPRLELIRTAGILHDLGKIGVAEGVLNKPGKLTEAEFDLVRKHPLIASTILEPIERLETVIDDIKYHHEHYDGSGYPEGLKGEDIPLGARILMVADSFDAMTHKRPYSEPKTRRDAIVEMRACAGAQFDPEIVEILAEIVAEEDAKAGPGEHRKGAG